MRIYLFGMLYSLTWQFAQFVSLLQALALFGLATIGLIDKDKVVIGLIDNYKIVIGLIHKD